MTHDLQAGLVRILDSAGSATGLGDSAIGAGFLANSRSIVTCGHVVNLALGLGETADPSGEVVVLDFPLLRSSRIRARVEVWKGRDEEDITILSILDDLPDGARPVPLIVADDLWGHAFRAFGFPEGYGFGVWTAGQLLGPQAYGWVQAEHPRVSGYKLEPGYSGGPAWDDDVGGVVGVVVAADLRPDTRAGWVIPTSVLVAVFPALTTTSSPTRHPVDAPVPDASLTAFRAPDANPNFGGREEELARLGIALAPGDGAVLVQSISGLGGAGKTQIAIEYAHRHRDDYPIIWWVGAEEPTTIVRDLADLAKELGLAKSEAPAAETTAKLKDWLERSRGWLLIFDNAASLSAIDPYVPRVGGHVLITSRNPVWRARATVIDVDVWPPGEARAYLAVRTGQADDASAGDLAQLLGYLPLALEQAAAFMEETGVQFERYIELYRQQQVELLAREAPRGYEATVATTWNLSFTAVRAASPVAAELLELSAFLAPDDIAVDLFTGGPDLPLADHGVAAVAPLDLELAVGTLRKYSLVRRSEDAISVHRLVQEVVRLSLSRPVQEQRVRACLLLVDHALSVGGIGVDRSRLDAHALTAAKHAESLRIEPDAVADLVRRVTDRQVSGQAQAIEILEEHIASGERAYGANSTMVHTLVVTLAQLRLQSGELDKARATFQRAVDLAQTALGDAHPELSIDLNSLAEVLHEQGAGREAKSALVRALTIDQTRYGAGHPILAAHIANLGTVERALGDPRAAQHDYERALAIDEGIWGRDDSTLLVHLVSLASVLQEIGDVDGARHLYQRAVTIIVADEPWEKLEELSDVVRALHELGDPDATAGIRDRAVTLDYDDSNRRDVERYLVALAEILRALGDLEGAKLLYKRALDVRQDSLGPDDPGLIEELRNLADVVRDLGDPHQADLLVQRAVSIIYAWDPSLGTPLSAMLKFQGFRDELFGLARILRANGDWQGAGDLYERGLDLVDQIWEEDASGLVRNLPPFADELRELGDLEAAKDIYEFVVRIRDEAAKYAEADEDGLADEHLVDQDALIADLGNLGRVYWELDDYEGAAAAARRVLALVDDRYGIDHLDTAIPALNLATALRELGDTQAAGPLYRRAATTILRSNEALRDPELLSTLEQIADEMRRLGDKDEARAISDRALAAREATTSKHDNDLPVDAPRDSRRSRRSWLHRRIDNDKLVVIQVQRWAEARGSTTTTTIERRPLT